LFLIYQSWKRRTNKLLAKKREDELIEKQLNILKIKEAADTKDSLKKSIKFIRKNHNRIDLFKSPAFLPL
jgi:hypothetical protein